MEIDVEISVEKLSEVRGNTEDKLSESCAGRLSDLRRMCRIWCKNVNDTTTCCGVCLDTLKERVYKNEIAVNQGWIEGR